MKRGDIVQYVTNNEEDSYWLQNYFNQNGEVIAIANGEEGARVHVKFEHGQEWWLDADQLEVVGETAV